jgi:uncharacterized surface protein with fasciclin (FAS1) repeats
MCKLRHVQILLLHVIEGKVTSEDLEDGMEVETLSGEEMCWLGSGTAL